MKISLLPNPSLSSFAIHLDEMSASEFDSIRIILYTLAKEKIGLNALHVEDLSLQTLIEEVAKRNVQDPIH